MAHDEHKAPFPYAGGKSKAAAAVWSALGDVSHYVEPFAGSLAVLLNRPHLANRAYYSETVNDLDGLLVNTWRSIQLSPQATAEAASWPVSECDQHARHCALIRWRQERQLEHLMGDPLFHDPVMAGYWLYGAATWIGSGWCSGAGPWWPDDEGRLSRGRGVSRQLPAVSHDGKGVHAPQLREEGVSRQLPRVSDDGTGVHSPQLREEGVSRQLPHVSNNGTGVHAPQLMEEGVSRQLPHVSDDGNGVHSAGLREEGVPHPVTMPKLRRWFDLLSARLRHVRIINGTWQRVCTSGVVNTLSCRNGKGAAGIFLDPPYANEDRQAGLYTCDDASVPYAVREWCLANTDSQWRIVLAGYEGAYAEPLLSAGWRAVDWSAGRCGLLEGGYGKQGKDGSQIGRERLWLNPACLGSEQGDMFR
jgi:hypothetical protein